MFPAPLPRPESAENPVTFEELMSSDDHTNAVLFLFTLDERMSPISL